MLRQKILVLSTKSFENTYQRNLDTCELQMHEMPEQRINSLESAEARAQKIVLLGLIMPQLYNKEV